MKRAIRPVPIMVPLEEPPSDFKLTDSGVFEQGGIVVSKAGCIIKSAAAQSDAGAAQLDSSKREQNESSCCSSSRPASRISTPAAKSAAGAGVCSTPGTTAAAAAAAAGLEADAQRSSAAANGAGTPASSKDAGSGSSPAAGSPSSSSRQGSSQSGIALDDLQEIAVIGRGSSGVVKKVLHKPSGGIYVLKVINFDMGCEQVRRQVTTEVRAMDGARHPHIVSYHQSYFANGAMTILMEFMDGGSLWDVLQRHKAIPGRYLPELARQVLLGLSHLHDAARICHRDIKPSNLLLSSSGQLKISDFGVSSQLSNSMSRCLSWVGTVTYMSPERIQGHSYGFNTDVWSLGLLLLECAVGRYPYPPQGEAGEQQQQQQRLGFWELLEYIVVEPAPRLPASQFARELVDFVGQCLQKDAARRPSAADMLAHPFITQGARADLSELLAPAPARAKAKAAAAGAAQHCSAMTVHC
ncbi:hypothetical protein OEZ86_003444 [Tetradesmus obliquus]|nr:hypothetical protein OEZ86_003444 [Tetradesmus obliquus]